MMKFLFEFFPPLTGIYFSSYDSWSKTILLQVDSGHNSQEDGCAKGWPSFQCRCGMTPVSCVPKDDFHVVLRCDGTGAILPTPCGYTKKIGTTFGDELSETISISASIGKLYSKKSFSGHPRF